MGEPDKALKRLPPAERGLDVIEYRFEVTINVQSPALDERRVRQLIDDEMRKLQLAVQSRTR
jgi:hypothetical protein